MKLRSLGNLLSDQFGLDLLRLLRGFTALPAYVLQMQRYLRASGGRDVPLVVRPCLHDSRAEGGATQSEYFWQDLYVARQIAQANPTCHLDVGSRVDGFVAHVASFRAIEVMDIRPITANVPGVIFRQMDLMQLPQEYHSYCDSLSCLHALEHFGLGRYGDPIKPLGHEDGLRNLSRILRPRGTLYLALPVGRARVLFNSHRVLDPHRIVSLALECGLSLQALSWHIPGVQGVKESTHPDSVKSDQPNPFERELALLKSMPYALGIFRFVREENK